MQELVRSVQAEICAELESLEGQPFEEVSWERPGGGGGWSRSLQGGRVFDKAGVNVSVVHGMLGPDAVAAMRARHETVPAGPQPFFACGISLVIHPKNPFAPTAHANYRYFELGDGQGMPVASWFGGGADLTPNYLNEADARHFHGVLKAACDKHDPDYYPRFKAWADEYFLIQHRKERRGLGGIFFDDLDGPASLEARFAFVTDCARAFVPAYVPLVRAHQDDTYGEAEQRWQRLRRGRYVEFNLVYDRGTTFGLRTDARIESVLMSLPLEARWEIDVVPEPGSAEALITAALREPREWA